jgi:hypothetical protein
VLQALPEQLVLQVQQALLELKATKATKANKV